MHNRLHNNDVMIHHNIIIIGSWMNVNGEAIYKTKPWHYQNDTVNGHFWYNVIVIIKKEPINSSTSLSTQVHVSS